MKLPAASTLEALSMDDEPRSPIKFLVVDDLEDNLLALSALLRRPGLEVLLARSGREALELLLDHEVALALVDVQMPEMDGFELAELMRGAERTRAVPIIFITAGARESNRVFRGYDAGAVDFLFKPVDPHVLRHKADVFFQLHVEKQERERLTAELRETLRLNETFVAAISHDLRSPLSAIVTTAEMLIRRGGDPSARRSAERILSSGKRMAAMIDALFDLARARLGGGIPVDRRRTDLLPLARKVLAEHQATSPDRVLELEHDGELVGFWDGDRIEQLLSNLLGNAIRHGKTEGPVRLRLDGRRTDSITLSVSNAGEIDADVLPTIFDPFRVGATSRERGTGLGLGLYIVQQIVVGHGGRIEVESSAQSGTCFQISMPRVEEAAQARAFA